MLFNTGCSINSYGFPGSVEEESYEGNSSFILKTKASGIHLDTRSALELHIGYMEREMIYPRVSKDKSLCVQQFISPENIEPLIEEIIYAEDAIKISVKSQGARLSLSPYLIGLNIGLINRKELRVSIDDSLSMFYSNKKQPGMDVCAVIESKNQGENHEN
jgi:hypothetical protein